MIAGAVALAVSVAAVARPRAATGATATNSDRAAAGLVVAVGGGASAGVTFAGTDGSPVAAGGADASRVFQYTTPPIAASSDRATAAATTSRWPLEEVAGGAERRRGAVAAGTGRSEDATGAAGIADVARVRSSTEAPSDKRVWAGDAPARTRSMSASRSS